MNIKRCIPTAAMILALVAVADAKKPVYETGRLIAASPKYVDSPRASTILLLPPDQTVIGYAFEIQVGDLTYSVDAALCCPMKSKYKPEWVTGGTIEFRFDKDKMFVRRPNGHELKARLDKVASIAVNVPPSPPVRADTSGLQSFVGPPSRRTKTLPLGIDFLRSGDSCLILDGDVVAGDFFDGLQSHKTSSGIAFRKGSEKVEAYPPKMTVRIYAALGVCSEKERSSEGSTVKQAHFDEELMRSLVFDGAWKHGFDEKKAELGPVVEGRISNPTPFPTDREWWEYEFDVRSDGVRLSDSLVIILQSPDGRLLARLSGRAR